MNTDEPNLEFEALLNYIKRNRGFDFTGYKRASLMRRVRKRMQEVGIETFSEYVDCLEVDPQEFAHLFNTILINVTSFFRDRSAWEYIIDEIVPRISARKEPTEPIRVWSVGCASGQEAYTLAIALAEALGLEQLQSRVKIYATDVDQEALNRARFGAYSATEISSIPTDLVDKYFELSNNLYTFRKELRRSVIFGRHDLIQDAPISRIDLLVCRNTLMYFNVEAQAKILARFHFALNDSGFLFLGKAEMLLAHSSSFTPVDLKRRIFLKVPKVNLRDRLLLMGNNGGEDEASYLNHHVRIRDVAFDSSPVAQIVVDINSCLTLANEKARLLFGINPRDLGRPLQDLEVSYRPVELRSCIDRVYAERRAIIQREVEWAIPSSNETQYFDVQVLPLLDTSAKYLGVSISFTDITRLKRLQEELEHASQELEMTTEELQSTNEELETTNEELQSSNEELETTNEELQSTNEELETMNEELQSSNEELQTINEELRLRSDELNEVNSFLESIFTSLRGGVVVMNQQLQIQVWNKKAEDLWGLRIDEVVGQHFFNLDIGLPIEQLRQPIRNCLMSSESPEIVLDAMNRRGRTIQCKVTCTPLISSSKEICGVITIMEELGAEETS